MRRIASIVSMPSRRGPPRPEPSGNVSSRRSGRSARCRSARSRGRRCACATRASSRRCAPGPPRRCEADDGRAVLAGEREHPVEARAWSSPSSRLAELRIALPPSAAARPRAPAARSSRTRAAARPASRSGRRSRPCRHGRRGRRSRRTRRGRARPPSPARAPSARRCPSRRRASRRGTSSSRWRSCARRPRGTRGPGGTGPCSRSTSSPARSTARGTGARVPSARRPRRRCSGVVPQQPPTMLMPNSATKRSCASASTSGVRS